MLQRRDVLDLFRSQYWAASDGQLRQLGISSDARWRAMSTGEIERVAPGVVGVPGACTAFESRAMVAMLMCGDGSFLHGQTAARLLGLRTMPDAPIEVAVPEDRHRVAPSWIRLVKTSWADDVDRRLPRSDHLVVASPLRMLFGLAARLNQFRFERAAEDAWHLGLVTPQDAAAYLARIRRRGLTGVARMERWLERVERHSRPAASALEQLVADLVAQSGLPTPTRQHPLRLASGELIHLDIAWPDVRLAIEPGHSWWHGGDLGQRRDQDRDRACGAVGWQVVRCDEQAWHDRHELRLQIAAIHRERTLLFAARG